MWCPAGLAFTTWNQESYLFATTEKATYSFNLSKGPSDKGLVCVCVCACACVRVCVCMCVHACVHVRARVCACMHVQCLHASAVSSCLCLTLSLTFQRELGRFGCRVGCSVLSDSTQDHKLVVVNNFVTQFYLPHEPAQCLVFEGMPP